MPETNHSETQGKQCLNPDCRERFSLATPDLERWRYCPRCGWFLVTKRPRPFRAQFLFDLGAALTKVGAERW